MAVMPRHLKKRHPFVSSSHLSVGVEALHDDDNGDVKTQFEEWTMVLVDRPASFIDDSPTLDKQTFHARKELIARVGAELALTQLPCGHMASDMQKR